MTRVLFFSYQIVGALPEKKRFTMLINSKSIFLHPSNKTKRHVRHFIKSKENNR